MLLLGLFLLAQVGCHDDRIAKLLGGSTTHHYVLLDDSFSMSDRNQTESVFDRARETLSLIAARAKNRQNQKVTLIRFSAGQTSPKNTQADSSPPDEQPLLLRADLDGELVDDQFDRTMESLKSRLTASNLAVNIEEVLPVIKQSILDHESESSIVYVISDFRKRDWGSPAAAREFREIHESGAAIELIACASEERANLAITSLVPSGNVRVAGVPLMMEFTVRNCSSIVASKVQIKISTIAVPKTTANPGSSRVVELPSIFVQTIPPGETVKRKFPVFFESTGDHIIFVDLPDDALQVDNRRWSTVEFKAQAKVLIIDDEQQLHSRYLALALNPGRMTGVRPEIRTKDYLRNASAAQFLEYESIFLLDVDSFETSVVENLESYVEAGGGLAFFAGPKTNFEFYNSQLYRDGTGLLPMPYFRSIEIPELLEEKTADISPNSHPIFAPILNVKNSLLDLVQVSQIVEPTIDWVASQNQPSRKETVLATVRGQAGWPLVIEKSFGRGQVILFTSTAGSLWNNWSRNATFPPVLLLLQDYLAAGRFEFRNHLAGDPIHVELPRDAYLPRANYFLRAGGQTDLNADTNQEFDAVVAQSDSDPSALLATIGGHVRSSLLNPIDSAGIIDLNLTSIDGAPDTRRFAINVDISESDMKLAESQDLINQLEASHPTWVAWDKFSPQPKEKAGSTLSRLLLLGLIALLIAEQLLGYSASYHR